MEAFRGSAPMGSAAGDAPAAGSALIGSAAGGAPARTRSPHPYCHDEGAAAEITARRR